MELAGEQGWPATQAEARAVLEERIRSMIWGYVKTDAVPDRSIALAAEGVTSFMAWTVPMEAHVPLQPVEVEAGQRSEVSGVRVVFGCGFETIVPQALVQSSGPINVFSTVRCPGCNEPATAITVVRRVVE